MIKFVVFDFDGVFTDGKCYFDSSNTIIKYYNIKDGMALSILKNNNIKTGLISSYNTNKNIINKEIDNEIINHLNFDYKFIGKKNKIDILNEWLVILDLSYNNVAYIGDDINDIDIIKKVGLSACPSDAIEDCKNIVNYICQNKGGNGCIREFVDFIINKNSDIKSEIKKELNYQIDNINYKDIDKLNKLINESRTIYLSGIGKSETMANHLCNLLKSININAFYLNTMNALHGDIGTINSSDMIIFFSKSGNTPEIINLIPFIKIKNVKIVGVCCDKNNLFKKYCDYTIELPFQKEISGENDKIPTNSSMSQLLFINILVAQLKNNISVEEYKLNHPAGNIGHNLRKIKDCLILDFPKIILNNSISLNLILLEMTKYKIGCCFFIDNNDIFLGLLTDGDIRRLLIKNDNIKSINIDDINNNYYYESDENKFLFECKKSNYIPIIKNKKLIGIFQNF